METSGYKAKHRGMGKAILFLALTSALVTAQAEDEILPLPGSVFSENPASSNPILDLTDRFVGSTGAIQFQVPDALVVENENGQVDYDSEKKTVRYEGGDGKVLLKADTGVDVEAKSLEASMETKKAHLEGPLNIYQSEMFTRATHGEYNWETKDMDIYNVRSKVQGLIIRSSHIEYRKDDKGTSYMVIHDAYVTTDDVQKPGSWVGAGELTVYPGDYGRVTRLSLAGEDYDIPIPVVGWISFSHSLNPEEGYMPTPGSRSLWGSYLLNRYGFLIGNRRVEKGMPTADYILTTHLDYRTRRGFATGLDLKDTKMEKKFNMDGLSLYYILDKNPDINPTYVERGKVDERRWRVALESMWEFNSPIVADTAKWSAIANVNILSDKYVLRDFYEDLCIVNNDPDNTFNVTRKTDHDQAQVWTRFAPNDYYSTGERLEFSYYRVRSALAKSRITYETRNSAALMRQFMPMEQREAYREKLEELRDPELAKYYAGLLNTSSYFRVNSTHEFASNFTLLRFLNITPKLGFGYTGYYDVEGVGADNRFLGYAACNFDLKFHRSYPDVELPWMYGNGLYHLIRPYAIISHASVSSSNPSVPKVDMWMSLLNNASSNPMNLDLIGFTGIDGWGTWSVYRFGVSNILTTKIDGETHRLINWNIFVDYNAENPNTRAEFSNLYSILRVAPTQHCAITVETQTPAIRNGEGFRQYNASVSVQPVRWFEATMGYSYISDHPLITDSSQAYLRALMRLDEKHSIAAQWNCSLKNRSFPIQKYGIFRKAGPWYIGATLFLRDNGGRKETGMGFTFTLGETGTAFPVEFF